VRKDSCIIVDSNTDTLPETYYEPKLFASSPLNGTYLVFLVDSNYNNSAKIPAEVLWIASGVKFGPAPTAVLGQNGSVYESAPFNSSHVPYKAPDVPGHTYIVLMYNSPPNFEFPPNFPYNATFRTGFNVTRIGADFKSPVVEATYFTIASNASTSASATGGVPQPTGTGAHGSGYAPTASIEPFTGSANSLHKVVEASNWAWSLVACVVTTRVIGLW
jgi:hypothetical protein